MMARKHWYARKSLAVPFVILIVLIGIGAYEFFKVKADKPAYTFGTVERGDIVLQVAATGTLAAVTTVQVGTQVSGTISELYVDFNSEVKKANCSPSWILNFLKRKCSRPRPMSAPPRPA